MKKFPLFCTLYFVFCTSSVFAYTQTDISNAQFLADKWIIVKQSTIAGYRLDSTITRAELVGIALKLKWVALPSYKCKWYFSDVRNNDWICRAVELAADNSLVTRANARFRAQDNITRAEALAIVTRDIEDLPNSYEDPANYIDANSWQIKIIQKAMAAGIINPEVRIGKDMGGMFTGFKEKNIYFSPNRDATRAEVFGFVRNILWMSNTNFISEKYWFTFQYPSSWMVRTLSTSTSDYLPNSRTFVAIYPDAYPAPDFSGRIDVYNAPLNEVLENNQYVKYKNKDIIQSINGLDWSVIWDSDFLIEKNGKTFHISWTKNIAETILINFMITN